MNQIAATPGFVLINPRGLYDPTGYSHVAAVQPGNRLVFVSGQGGENESGELPPDFGLQVRQALENLKTALAAAGSEAGDIAKLTVLVVDHSAEKLRILNAELDRVLGTGPKPACTLIPVPRLALDDMLFEIDAVAVVPA